jgi:Flagellar P-ring protein/HEAT repeats
MCRAICVPGLALLVGLAGCLGLQTRPSREEIERDKELATVRVVGDVTEVGNAGPLQVSGVGLVTDLEGTGGSPRGQFRTLLEKDLRQRKVDNVGKLFDSPNNALVLVTGFIPPGARKHDPIDLQITLPENSPAGSLRGGYLQLCTLRNYEATKNIDPDYKGGNRLLEGHVLAVGKGPLLVFGNAGDKSDLKRARVWEGGVSLTERPFFLVLKKDSKSAAIANAVASRINLKFPADPKKQEFVQRHQQLFLLDDVTHQINEKFEPTSLGQSGDAAKAIGKDVVNVRVPYAYRYNPERYLRVARLIPLVEDADSHGKYRRLLHTMLQDPNPKVCIRAALRLEALGKESVAALQQGLTSGHAAVRFAAAEALTYLGSTSGVDELARAAVEQPDVRAYALIALAGLIESACRHKLQELLSAGDAEVRAGAFEALRLTYAGDCRNEKELDAAMERRLGGENLQAFWLHQVAPQGAKAVNFAISRRAEIILFGSDIALSGEVHVKAGEEFVITVAAGDGRCYVTRISAQHGEQRKSCSLRLDDVLRTLVDLGGQYPEAVDLLRKLDDQQGLNCNVRLLTPPQALPLEDLVADARNAMKTTGSVE